MPQAWESPVEFPASYVHEYAKSLDWSFEELLTHEMCHALDNGKGWRLSERADWKRVVRADNNYVSDYACQCRSKFPQLLE